MIELDGNYMEGGGQIVRIALALSCLTNKPFKIKDIRKGRGVPGLKHQHLKAVEFLSEVTQAFVEGAELKSTNLIFYPRKEFSIGNIEIDIETAGSITLLLQSILPSCIFSERKKIVLKIKGGTDVAWSMPYDYLVNVLFPQLTSWADIESKLVKRGYYPKGGGEIELIIKPKGKKELILLEQGKLVQIKGVVNASKSLQEKGVVERIAQTSELMLKRFDNPINVRREYCESYSDGCGIVLWGVFSKNGDANIDPVRVGSDALGEKRKSSEQVGKECVEKLVKEIESGAPVDVHLADNLIIYLGMVGGQIKVSSVSDHVLSAIYVVEQFLDVKFKVEQNLITVEQV
ncbi:RNA 3'-terminal phosphate cyclase [Candidatus Woesearchaeota archaeon]|jgi:RNA 3'-phosphate cyclase|nr:RNA 3'-terminal phosphate cyclase [Candidatus Woesearchaeota archaeon]MBT3304757.1 RNA 3'-terminal phosphate cyclase [Candidatus Woesearchaeota archaeon]MBT4367907.1 RNA 3'-terminal phosphate cyclase [Candidatus Woesearchaeota archaeon]MBT4712395.1 RNA 3'-terminal phosphate cyclase [Candidatus Woesearchaeota archaeon]MBT6639307.1 RNA 3'-terminal phosphate cyclase [Candidatus Woesearchaeota archaeon]